MAIFQFYKTEKMKKVPSFLASRLEADGFGRIIMFLSEDGKYFA